LLEFKAGRLFRDGETNWVRPDPRKGLCFLKKEDDGLLRFCWKDRQANQVDEELIVFPGDVTFEKVQQSSGRVYVLKFKSSAQRQFFWIQEPATATVADDDKAIAHSVNVLLSSEDGRSREGGSDITSIGSSSGGGIGSMSPAELNNLRQLLSSIRVPEDYASARGRGAGALKLGDVLTPQNLAAVLRDDKLRQSLFPTLPEDIPHTEGSLDQVVRSPQFQQALNSLSYVLESGQIAPLVSQLGLEPEASTSVEAFLQAIEKQVEKE
ncbi:adhesion regulating molecule, partial [Martensiomyces pterosporus]